MEQPIRALIPQLKQWAFPRGIRKENKAPRYLLGYQLFDKVLHEGQECFVFGRRTSGYFDLRKLDGTKVSASASYKKLVGKTFFACALGNAACSCKTWNPRVVNRTSFSVSPSAIYEDIVVL